MGLDCSKCFNNIQHHRKYLRMPRINMNIFSMLMILTTIIHSDVVIAMSLYPPTISSSSYSPTPCCDGEFGHGRWRYRSDGVCSDRFVVGTPIEVEYISPANNVTWTLPADCHVEPGFLLEAKLTRFHCDMEGDNFFSVTLDGDKTKTDSFYIKIAADSGSLDWYVIALDTSSFSNPKALSTLGEDDGLLPNVLIDSKSLTAQLHIWIMNYQFASESELAGTAVIPSKASQEITLEFETLGEVPLLFGLSQERIISKRYYENLSYWEIIIQTELLESHLHISVGGKNVSVFSHHVHPRKFIILRQTYYFSALFTPPQKAILAPINAPSRDFFTIFTDACTPNVNIILSPLLERHQLYLSQNDLVTTVVVSLVGIPGAESSKVSVLNGALVRGTIVVVTELGVFYSNSDGLKWKPSEGLPNESSTDWVTHIATSMSCDPLLVSKDAPWNVNDAVVAWNPISDGFYWSVDRGQTFVLIKLPPKYSTAVIQHVSVHTSYPSIAVLVKTNVSVVASDSDDSSNRTTLVSIFLQYYYNTDSWGEGFPFGHGINVKSYSNVRSRSGDLFAWGDQAFYSPTGGVTVSQLNLLSRDPKVSSMNLASGEVILQIETSQDGQLVILTSLNRIFYGMINLPLLVEVQSGEKADAMNVCVRFDGLHLLNVVTARGISVTSRRLPIINEIMAPRVPLANNEHFRKRCPYIEIWDTMKPLYYIDMNEKFSFEASVTPVAGSKFVHSLIFSNRNLIDFSVQTTSKQTAENDVVTYNQLFEIHERPMTFPSYDERRWVTTGHTDLRLHPQNNELTCLQRGHVSRVRVGCPPTRRLRVRVSDFYADDPSCEAWPDGRSYEIKGAVHNPDPLKSALNEPTETDSVLNYDSKRFGCPFNLYFLNDFKPVLELWDGDVLVREVTEAFVLREVNGRFDFSYTLSALDAGCKSAPQTWASQLQENPDTSTAWRPSNYRSCMTVNSDWPAPDNNQKYEILSKEPPGSEIHWKGRGGLYIFEVTIVDTEVSFCHLHAEFAADVYGAPISAVVGVSIVVGISLGICFGLVISYFYFQDHASKKIHQE